MKTKMIYSFFHEKYGYFALKEIVQSSYKQIILNEFGNYQKTEKYLWTFIEFWRSFWNFWK